MSDYRFLYYLPDPFGAGLSRYFVGTPEAHIELAPEALGECKDAIVTYDAGTLVDDLRRRGFAPPSGLIDVGEAIRLCVGISRADGGERIWNIWSNLKPHFESRASFDIVRSRHTSRSLLSEEMDVGELANRAIRALQKLWAETLRSLEAKGEAERFFQIEISVAAILFQRQYLGIAISTTDVDSALTKASEMKYSAYLNIGGMLDASPTGLSYWNISDYIPRTDLAGVIDDTTGYNLRDQMRMAGPHSQFARAFEAYMSASRDVDILTRFADADGRVFPTFHPIGTITSRILLSDPYIQELKRSYRGLIIGDPGHELVYIDYSQFEPGIMAELSGDDGLIEMYNKGDVYKALSRDVFNNDDNRDVCKRIFLAFCYGMEVGRIGKLIAGSGASGEEIATHCLNVSRFFARFERFAMFRAELESRLARDGSVSSEMGNHRYRSTKGKLLNKERRWAVSQVVQGTASLIFKKAILALTKEFGANSVLVPMHDAVLLQMPSEHSVEGTSRATAIMKETFREMCPSLLPRVTVSKF